MSIDLLPSLDLDLPPPASEAVRRITEPAVLPSALPDVSSSYDGSNVMFHVLRLSSWGPALMNLGWHKYRGAFRFMNIGKNLERAQRRLVMKTIDLLGVQPGERALDLACGRGKSSFMLSTLQPRTTVVGVDLLDENVQVARTLFGQVSNLSYAAGSAMELSYAEGTFDRVMCIEAAFHFPDRGAFLREACRVLRPGGRLVVVDFAWNSNQDREHLEDPETQLVRKIWQWDDFFSIPEYELRAREAGFNVASRHDWTSRVTHPIQGMLQYLSGMGKTRIGRWILTRKNPMYGSLTAANWEELGEIVKAHYHVQRFSKYMAFVFEKR